MTDESRERFLEERTRALATVILTRRSDLTVTEAEAHSGLDLLAYVCDEDEPTRARFGILLRGEMSPVTPDRVNKILRPAVDSFQRTGPFAYPVCLFFFTMRGDQAFYCWLAEPALAQGDSPELILHKRADCRELNDEALNNLVDRVVTWFSHKPVTYPEFEIPQPQIADHAGQFADVAIYLYDRLHEIRSAAPSVLLESALALELYLKSLNARTVSHPDGGNGFQLTASAIVGKHELVELFDAIEEPIRDELQTAYELADIDRKPPFLRDALALYSDLFVGVRYYFEKQNAGGGNNVTRLVDLVRFFHRHVGNMPKRFRTVPRVGRPRG